MSSSSIPSATSFSSPSSSTTTSSLGWLLVLPSLTNGDSDRVVPRDEADLKNAGDLKKPGDIKKPGLRLRVEVVAAPARARLCRMRVLGAPAARSPKRAPPLVTRAA